MNTSTLNHIVTGYIVVLIIVNVAIGYGFVRYFRRESRRNPFNLIE